MEIPQFRDRPQPVWLLCEQISREKDHPEYVVRFCIGGELFLTFVPVALADSVDEAGKRLKAFIVADFDNDWVIDVPGETMPSGPRFRVPSTQQGLILEPV